VQQLSQRKATRRPWRNSASLSAVKQSTPITKPGDCVSVDQLISHTPGLVAQLRGIPTKMRYRVATVYVDQYSRLSYVHLQKTTSAEETLESKRAFENYAASFNVRIQHYHADNGVFADKQWTEAVAAKGQTMSFCGVGAHFQNGISERRIRSLQDQARTMLVHAQSRMPSAINNFLWPYAF
jgi:hypothetical protein